MDRLESQVSQMEETNLHIQQRISGLELRLVEGQLREIGADIPPDDDKIIAIRN